MGIPTIYRWDDAGAPILNGLAGSAIAVIQACLVDGYGSKPAAGWTKPFHTGDIAVFQAAAGRVLKLWDDGSHVDTRAVRVAGGASAADIDTIADMHPPATDDNAAWLKSPEVNGTAREWMVVADENRFYFLPHTTLGVLAGTGVYQGIDLKLYFYGRYASLKPGDTQNWLLWATSNINTGSTQNWSPSTVSLTTDVSASFTNGSFNGFAADELGVIGQHARIHSAGAPGMVCNGILGGRGLNYPDTVSGGLWLTQAYLYQPINNRNYIRGAWPGFLIPGHTLYRHNASHPFDYLLPNTILTPYGQRQCLLIPTRERFSNASTSAGAGAFFLDIESDWDNIAA